MGTRGVSVCVCADKLKRLQKYQRKRWLRSCLPIAHTSSLRSRYPPHWWLHPESPSTIDHRQIPSVGRFNSSIEQSVSTTSHTDKNERDVPIYMRPNPSRQDCQHRYCRVLVAVDSQCSVSVFCPPSGCAQERALFLGAAVHQETAWWPSPSTWGCHRHAAVAVPVVSTNSPSHCIHFLY